MDNTAESETADESIETETAFTGVTTSQASQSDPSEQPTLSEQDATSTPPYQSEQSRHESLSILQTQHRRLAATMGLLGVLSLIGGMIFTESQTLFFALGATGLFGGLLTYYLIPERFVSASVGDTIHSAYATDRRRYIDKLELQDEQVYVPDVEARTVRLFVPQQKEYTIPDRLDRPFVNSEDPAARGGVFTPTGCGLYGEFAASVPGEPAEEPRVLVAQIADAVVETFGFAKAIETELDTDSNQVTCTVVNPMYGDLETLDHPIISFVASSLAIGLGVPITTTYEDKKHGNERFVCRWEDTKTESQEEQTG